ncbi:hypothetical protein [Flavobacterium urocaniciphilum]|uniref:Uncharacterized protein n=1 Tax=Flavobacterium urocaniciphilum TaxID=1299341 RepID=A0A1H9DPV2_9FLAO|nr:hypothetical protein [Flavobacterium urocaniciphilum]SEQ15512.1 hypothetical protein SAMN05444005_1083 [Flavobacterium urocaniciphilum]
MKKILFFFLLPFCVFSQQVGINTTDPKATLDVNGNMLIRDVPIGTSDDILTISETDNVVTKFNFKGFDLLNRMLIPSCSINTVGATGSFNRVARGVTYVINWEVVGRNTGSAANLSSNETASRMKIKYTITPPLPSVPLIAFLTPFNESNYPDAFVASYSELTNSTITAQIVRADMNSFDGGICWAGQFYFDLILFY